MMLPLPGEMLSMLGGMLPLPDGACCSPLSAAVLVGVAAHQPPPQVAVASLLAHRFHITKAGRLTHWFAERGLTRRLRSTDREFDAQWAIETDDVEFGEALVRHPAARAAVVALAELGVVSITQSRRKLTAVLLQDARPRLKDGEHKAAVEAQLTALQVLCAEVVASRHFPQRHGRARLFLGLALGAAALLVAGIVGCVTWSAELAEGEGGALVLYAVAVGLPLGLALLGAAMVPLAGRSTSHKELGPLAVTIVPGVVLLCVAGALLVNRAFDPGPAVQHRVPVLELRERHNDDDFKGYWAIVPDWRGADRPTRRIRFGVRDGSELVAGKSELLLHVSPGRLGAGRLLRTVIVNREER